MSLGLVGVLVGVYLPALQDRPIKSLSAIESIAFPWKVAVFGCVYYVGGVTAPCRLPLSY